MLRVKEMAKMLNITNVRVKQLLKENNLPFSQTGHNRGLIHIPHETVRKMMALKNKSYTQRIATIGIEKGGVGKSLLTCNSAILLASRGCKVLLIDLDPEACSTNLLLPDSTDLHSFQTIYEIYKHNTPLEEAILQSKYSGLDLLPCRGTSRKIDRLVADENPKKLLSKKIASIRNAYDLILFDIPPTFSKLISSAYLTSDMVIMPTFPDIWSMESLQLTIDDIQEDVENFDARCPEIKILMNKFNGYRTASKEAWDFLVNDYKDMVLPFHVRDAADLQNSINEGLSIFETKSSKELKESIQMLITYLSPIVEFNSNT